ncbi:MAG: hypothetical protein LBC86_00025 [Oscillospiraceae bacterium]|jgi:hypothetical protein|nr:hypothetical protein [Oscillospiraceae bacterium]
MAITLAQLHAKLQALTPLTLTISDDTANAFRWLLFALNASELTIKNHSLTLSNEQIDIRGNVTFGLPVGEYAIAMRITNAPPDKERTFTVTFNANSAVKGKIGEVFGEIYPTFHPKDGVAAYENILNDIEISDTLTIDYSDDNYSELPLNFSCKAAIPRNTYWTNEPFCMLLNAAGASGILSGGMSPNAAFGDVKFSAVLDLATEFSELLPSSDTISTFIGLQNGASGSDDPVADFTMRQAFVSRVFAGLKFKAEGLSDEVNITSPMFRGGEYLCLGADFGAGLSPADMINFLAAAFGSVPSGHLMIPQAGFLDNFGLRNLSVTLRKQEDSIFPSLTALSAYISTKRPLQLPINSLTLNSLDLRFIIQWGYGEKLQLGRQLTAKDAESYLITGDIGANVSLDLPNKTKITLIANAALPDLEFEGTIRFTREGKNDAKTIMGDTVASTLPAVTLAEIYVIAGYTSRTLSFDAAVYDAVTISLAKTEVTLTELNVGARFTQSGNSFYFGGTLAFQPQKYDKFAFSLHASYNNGAWLFEGGLSSGTVSIAAVLDGIIGLNNVPAVFENIALTALWVRYRYKKDDRYNPFSLRAAIRADLSELFPEGFTLKAAAALALETDERGEIAASLLAELAVSNFLVTAQMDGIGTENPSFIFVFLFREKGIRAALYTREKLKYLTMNLVNISLGDIVDFFVKVADPNHTSTLPAPLDVLYKIDLSKFTLTYGISDGTLELTYALNLNLVVIKLNSVGVKYIPADSKNPSDVQMTLKVDSLLSNNDSPSWSLLCGSPPDFGGQGAVSFKLKYMGLLVHFDNNDNAKSILAADTITDALERMKGKVDKYNPAVNFAFAAHFTINDVFDAKVAFVDPHIYGFYITVSENSGPLKQLSGLALEMFYKRLSDNLGMFHAALIVPAKYRTFQLGAASVTLGLITVEIYTDGGFYIDLGFPHNRDFSRSFVFQIGIFTGRAGLYFGILSGAAVPALPDWSGGRFAPVIKAGIGVTFGIGRSFDFGIVKGGLELAAAGIFEGTLALWIEEGEFSPSGMYYRLSATLGIIGRLYVKVDLKIIVLSASVEINAFAQAVFETDMPVIIDLDLNLKLNGSVKILFIRIHFTYNFSYNAHFEIGDKARSRADIIYLDIRSLKFEQKTVVNWFIAPSLTMNGKTAFVPMISDFSPLYKMMLQLCLFGLRESLDRDSASFLDSDYVNDIINLDTLFSFIANNANFEISPTPAQPANDLDLDGYIIPLPPFVTLSITPDYEEDGQEIRDYAEFNPVTDEYIAKINAYFADIDKDNNTLLGNAGTPIAKVIFLDYFRALARQIYGELRGMFNGYAAPLDDLNSIANKYGVSAAKLAEANDTLKLKSNAEIIIDFTYICPKLTSFSALSDEISIDGKDFWEQISKLPILADTSIAVKKFTLSLEFEQRIAAAFIFVRWHGGEITTHWQKQYDDVLSACKKTADWECISFNEEDKFEYLGINWTVQLGDTAEHLAKMFTLINAESGYFPGFDEFLKKVSTVSQKHSFPDSLVTVHSSETPAGFARRVFVSTDKEHINSFDIIAKFANLPLRGVKFLNKEEQSLRDFIQAQNLDYATTAPYLKAEHFASGQTIAVKPEKIPLSEISEYLLSDDLMSRTAAFASRILTQGSRLPAQEGFDTIAFYELCGLQFPLEAGEYTVSLNSNDGSWVTGKQEYPVEVKPQANIRNKLPDGVTVKDIAPFAKAPLIYSVGEKFLYGNDSVIRYLPAVLGNKKFSLHYSDKTNVECQSALCLAFSVTRESDNVLRIVGLSPSDRVKLYPLIKNMNYSGCSFSVLYKPSSLSGISGVLLNTEFGENERFIKTNLSRTTKLNLTEKNNESNDYLCNLSEPLFIKMLWECSVTCGNYALYMSDANKLASDVFDTDNVTQLYLFISGKGILEDANCVFSSDTANINKDAYFSRENETAAKPALPNGSYGLRIEYTPDADSVSQILAYTITENGKTSNLSKPLIPLGDTSSDETNITVYELVFAVGRPYENFGKATVNVYLRDVFGNQSPEPTVHEIDYRVNDFIVAVNECYGVTCSYKFTESKITVTLAAKEKEDGFALPEQAEADLQRALAQQSSEDTSLFVTSSLFEGEIKVEKKPLYDFLFALHGYYTNSKDKAPIADILSVSIDGKKLPSEPIFPVETVLRIRRNVKTTQNAPQEVTCVDTVAAYNSGNFPIAGYALAHKNLSESDLFAVNLSQCVGTPIFEPPKYYASAPLANSLINGADINLWGQIFLDDFENAVLAKVKEIAQCSKNAVRDLLAVKENLATKISQMFIGVNGGAAPNAVTAYAADMLLNRIDSEISSIAAYAVKNTPSAQTRLTVELSRSDNARVNSGIGKLSSSNYFTVAYNAFSRYETNFNLIYSSANIRHFESDIATTSQGYESSHWYSFLAPQQLTALMGEVKGIPNPLREVPPAPQLSNSRFEPQLDGELKNLSLSSYKLDITSIAAEQDKIEILITFNAPGKYPVSNNDNIYTALSEYMDVRDKLTSNLNEENVKEFNRHAQNICAKWSPMNALKVYAVNDNNIATILTWENGELKSSNSKVEVAYESPVIFGKLLTVTISVSNLSVYNYTSAIPYAKIVRNANFADAFVFRTEEISAPEVTSQNTFDADIDLGTVGGWDAAGIEAKCKRIYDILFTEEGPPDLFVESELTYAYTHKNAAAPIRLPVAMFKNAAVKDVQAIANRWFSSAKPSANSARLEFSVRVYNGSRAVLSARRIIVQ